MLEKTAANVPLGVVYVRLNGGTPVNVAVTVRHSPAQRSGLATMAADTGVDRSSGTMKLFSKDPAGTQKTIGNTVLYTALANSFSDNVWSAAWGRSSAIQQVVERALLRIDGARGGCARAPRLRPMLNDVAGLGVTLRDATLDRLNLKPGRITAPHDRVEDASTHRDANHVAGSYRIKSHAGRS